MFIRKDDLLINLDKIWYVTTYGYSLLFVQTDGVTLPYPIEFETAEGLKTAFYKILKGIEENRSFVDITERGTS